LYIGGGDEIVSAGCVACAMQRCHRVALPEYHVFGTGGVIRSC